MIADRKKVVVTGMGVLCSTGSNKYEFFDNCLHGVRSLTDTDLFDTSKLMNQNYGTVKDLSDYHCEHHDDNRIRNLFCTAATEALADAKLSPPDIKKLGIRASMTLGALSFDDDILNTYVHNNPSVPESSIPAASQINLSYLSDFSVFAKKYCGIQGAVYNFSSACAAGSTAIGVGAQLIRSGSQDIVLACGIDALSEMVCYGFHSLRALSENLCKPLDESRDGINIGEGCGFLVLEEYEHAKQRGADYYGECIGYSLSNDAYHLTSPDVSGGGFFQSMDCALKNADISIDELDYINLHGTGTRINDSTELKALERLCAQANHRPYISSIKTLVGHCMGASGALEAIATLLSLSTQRLLPACYIDTLLEEGAAFENRICKYTKQTNLQYALSNSFAFGGNAASIVFKKGENNG